MRLTDVFVSARKIGIEHSDSVSNISPLPCFEEPGSIRQTDIPELVLIVSAKLRPGQLVGCLAHYVFRKLFRAFIPDSAVVRQIEHAQVAVMFGIGNKRCRLAAPGISLHHQMVPLVFDDGELFCGRLH